MIVCVCKGCGQSWMADSEQALCSACEAVRDELTCAECGTALRVPVPTGLCGICDPLWDAERDAVAA